MMRDQVLGLGPFLLVLPACNQAVVEFPPSRETSDLIIETIGPGKESIFDGHQSKCSGHPEKYAVQPKQNDVIT